MANEILPGPNTGNGNFDCVFYYAIPLAQRIAARDSEGNTTAANVVWTPSASAPAWVKFTAAEATALNAGEAMFVPITISQSPGETDQAFLARVQQMYADLSSPLLAKYQQTFKHLNKRFNS